MTAEAQIDDSADAAAPKVTPDLPPKPPAAPTSGPPPKPARKRRRTGLGARLFLLMLAVTLAFAALGLSGKPIGLPLWAVVEIEDRLNRNLGRALPEGALAIGGMEITVDSDWVPRLRLQDIRLLKQGGQALITLPDLRLTLDPQALLRGQVRARSLRLIGAKLTILRDRDGRFDLSLGAGRMQPPITSFAGLFDAADAFFASPIAASLQTVEAEALSITLNDQRAGRVWEVGDGRLTLQNRATELAAELGLSLVGGGAAPARAVFSIVSEKGAQTARVTAQIDGVAAQDIASQAAPLAWAGIVTAPISGRIATTLDEGGITAMEAKLEFGRGALQPRPEAQPIDFDRAAMSLRYDPAAGRINLTEFSVQSPSLRVKATGHSYLTRADGSAIQGGLATELPAAFLTQLQFSQVMVDPDGLFQEPVTFSAGALDLRLRLEPFSIEIGQLTLAEDKRRLTAKGTISADVQGWKASVDLGLNEIAHDRLLALWPMKLLPNTRGWVGRNVLKGALFDVQAALRIEPGAEPRLHLGYSFAEADVRFLTTLPPINAGYGYATIDGQTYTMVMSRGTVTPPQGGQIDMAGSVFKVPDVTAKPAMAEITLSTDSSLTAALSLLDLPPFHFMTKAAQPVALGEGSARIRTQLRMPLQKKIALKDVSYDVVGTVSNFRSDRVVPNRVITADSLAVTATPKGLTIAGQGLIGAVPFDVTYAQSFAPDQKGRARIEGSVTLSQGTAEEFGLGLPAGMVSGQGQGEVEIDLVKGSPGRLRLVSDLNRIGLTIPELGWSKPAAGRGRLEAVVQLGQPPKVERLVLDAAGLKANGSVSMRPGGGLDVARFDRVELGDWLDGPVEIRGRGAGRAVGLAVLGGSVDLRRMPAAADRKSAAKGGSPLDLRLDQLRVSDSISLTSFRGDFSLAGGVNGSFISAINGMGTVKGTVVPSRHGSAIRLQSNDAGQTLTAAKIFSSARGGSLDVQLTPRATPGHYDGTARIRNVRVRNASVLAELLNAISVVGLLEQMMDSGLVFNEADGEFLLTPDAVEVRRGSAIGASLGVSMAGVYQSKSGRLAMQGVVSPIYLLNGIGAMFTRRGEGVFGFNYTLRGTAEDPQIDVNPLSILTPGMFREIFRSGPPVLQGNGP